MGLTRMAKAPAVYALFCLIVLAQAVCASPRLPDGISDFVPDCAARCFRSFLDVNYQGTRCGSRESLRCFCTTQGNTGFTLGEGALQCIAVEGRFGGCSQHAARRKGPQAAQHAAAKWLTDKQRLRSMRRTTCALVSLAQLVPRTK